METTHRRGPAACPLARRRSRNNDNSRLHAVQFFARLNGSPEGLDLRTMTLDTFARLIDPIPLCQILTAWARHKQCPATRRKMRVSRTMKTLKPDARFDLEHRAYFLREWPGTSMFTAAAGDGNVSLVDLKAKAVRLHRPAMKLRAVCPHPTKPIVAWV